MDIVFRSGFLSIRECLCIVSLNREMSNLSNTKEGEKVWYDSCLRFISSFRDFNLTECVVTWNIKARNLYNNSSFLLVCNKEDFGDYMEMFVTSVANLIILGHYQVAKEAMAQNYKALHPSKDVCDCYKMHKNRVCEYCMNVIQIFILLMTEGLPVHIINQVID